jgi:hypothetical protein
VSAKTIRQYAERFAKKKIRVVHFALKTRFGFLRALVKRDPFQKCIPCWKSFAGPLDPVEPYSGGFADNE